MVGKIIRVLFHGSVLALALSSQLFPYSKDAPKRVVFQHTIQTIDADQVSGASFDFAVVDSNSLMFDFNHAPEVAKELHGDRELSFDTVLQSDIQTWMLPLEPPSYICRLSGTSHENWTFWLEASSPEPLRVDIDVVTEPTKRLKDYI